MKPASVAYWDYLSRDYDRLYRDRWSTLEDDFLASVIRRVIPVHRLPLHVLDLGCGTGLGLTMLPCGYFYSGADVIAGMIAQARAKWPQMESRFYVEDMTRSRFMSGGFDLILSLHAPLSYCGDPEAAASEIKRLLRPGGRFV